MYFKKDVVKYWMKVSWAVPTILFENFINNSGRCPCGEINAPYKFLNTFVYERKETVNQTLNSRGRRPLRKSVIKKDIFWYCRHPPRSTLCWRSNSHSSLNSFANFFCACATRLDGRG